MYMEAFGGWAITLPVSQEPCQCHHGSPYSRERFFLDSTNGSLTTLSWMVYCYTHSRHRPYLSVSPRWADKAMHSSYAAPTSKYHHEFISMPWSMVARHPRRAFSNSSSFLWSATAGNAAIIPIRPRCPRSTRNKERHLPTAFARSRENWEGSLLWWWDALRLRR